MFLCWMADEFYFIANALLLSLLSAGSRYRNKNYYVVRNARLNQSIN